MTRRRMATGFGMLVALWLGIVPARAAVQNGDFSQGLAGWTADYDFGASVPETGRETTADQGYAQLFTQGEDSAVALSSLWQGLAVPDDAGWLSFDLWLGRDETSLQEPSGGWSGFPDFLEVSYLDDLLDLDLDGNGAPDASSFDRYFVGLDAYGPYDPDTLAPVGYDDLGNGWMRFRFEIPELAGRSGTLYFDLWNDTDGYDTEARIDNVEITPVPEPATGVLLGLGLAGLGASQRRKRRDAR